MVRLTPYLLFDGNCAEAMQFYQTCFGGDLMLIRLADTPMKASFPEEKHSRITYGQLKERGGRVFSHRLAASYRNPETGQHHRDLRQWRTRG